MKKRLSEAQFQACINGMEIGQQSQQIAHGVLVMGRRQSEYVALLSLSKGAVSQAVGRVWAVFVKMQVPRGYERITVVLPERQAGIAKRWAQEAAKKRDRQA